MCVSGLPATASAPPARGACADGLEKRLKMLIEILPNCPNCWHDRTIGPQLFPACQGIHFRSSAAVYPQDPESRPTFCALPSGTLRKVSSCRANSHHEGCATLRQRSMLEQQSWQQSSSAMRSGRGRQSLSMSTPYSATDAIPYCTFDGPLCQTGHSVYEVIDGQQTSGPYEFATTVSPHGDVGTAI